MYTPATIIAPASNAIGRIDSCRNIAARITANTGCRYVYAATTELSAYFSAHAFIRYAAMVGPAITNASDHHAPGGIVRHGSCSIGQAANGSITTAATANIRAMQPRPANRASA